MINACKKIIKSLNDHGFEAYMVGGFVRDYLLKIPYNDIDITTNALPSDVLKIFKGVPVGIDFGTVLVLSDGYSFEVTTYRIDGKYNDSRHPEKVTFSRSLEEDLKRRDFTINALALDINMNLIDLFDGRKDLENGLIKTVGDPIERFNEDALRILRAFYFKSKLGFKIEEKTFNSMYTLQNNLKNISIERIQNELVKITNGSYKDETFKLMKKFDVFKYYNLCFDYKIDDIFDLYIISFYLNKEIPKIYHLKRSEIKLINDSINILNNLKKYDRYNHYLYRELYVRCVKIYNRIYNTKIVVNKDNFYINNIKELDIKIDDLRYLGIDNKFFSTILKELEKNVVLGNVINENYLLKLLATKIYNKMEE